MCTVGVGIGVPAGEMMLALGASGPGFESRISPKYRIKNLKFYNLVQHKNSFRA